VKKFRGGMVFIAALALTLVIVSLQLAWNLRSPEYLQGVAAKAGTNEAIAAALPDYAASKLPNPQATKVTFSQYVTPRNVNQSLESLYLSISDAYSGKTDVVTIDLTPITLPIMASGYQIPPGTVFASDTVQVGGLASVLRLAQRSIIPSLLVLAAFSTLVVLLGRRRGILPSIRSVVLVTCLLLGGMFVATIGVPLLVSSLVSSSGLDAALRDIALGYTNVLIADAGRFYLFWMIVLVGVVLVLSLSSGLIHHTRRPNKRHKKQMSAPPSDVKEL